jgi:hypothetical protein
VRKHFYLLALILMLTISAGGLQAKDKRNKKTPTKIELQNCSLVRISYSAWAEDAAEVLPEGYTPAGADAEGKIYVLVDITQCENIRVNDRFDVGGGTLYHEILPFGVINPDGDRIGWGFPATHTNPKARAAFRRAGMPCWPAKELIAKVEIDLVDGTVVGEAVTDNLRPFGPDLYATFDGPAEYRSTWPAGAIGPPQHHFFRGRVTALTWAAVDDVDFYFGPPPDIEYEGNFALPVIEFQVFPPFGDKLDCFSGHSLIVEGVR